jgi:hypothetical protein
MNAKDLTARSFKPLLAKACLPAQCATLLFKQVVHVKFVQELLGHGDVSLALNVYSHLLPGMDEAPG